MGHPVLNPELDKVDEKQLIAHLKDDVDSCNKRSLKFEEFRIMILHKIAKRDVVVKEIRNKRNER